MSRLIARQRFSRASDTAEWKERRVCLLLFLVWHAVEWTSFCVERNSRSISTKTGYGDGCQTCRLSNVLVAKSTCDPLASKIFDDAIASTLSLHKASSFTAPRKHWQRCGYERHSKETRTQQIASRRRISTEMCRERCVVVGKSRLLHLSAEIGFQHADSCLRGENKCFRTVSFSGNCC